MIVGSGTVSGTIFTPIIPACLETTNAESGRGHGIANNPASSGIWRMGRIC